MNRSTSWHHRVHGSVWIQRAALAVVVVLGFAGVALANEAPSLTSFTAAKLGDPNNLWEFAGGVEDEFVEGCTVTIDGGPMFEPATASVNPDGSFSYTITLPPYSSGWVTAVATDQMGLESELMKVFVD